MMLGTFVGAPSDDAAVNATFEQAVHLFSAAMGYEPQAMNAFVDFSGDWGGWVAGARATAQAWVTSPVTRRLLPVLGLPMARNADWTLQPPLAVFDEIASGLHDDVWTGIIEAWRGAGVELMHVRIGYDMNGRFVPWFMGHSAADIAHWTAAFQRIAKTITSVPGIVVKTVWNPTAINWTDGDVALAWPGDGYVDVAGLDVVSACFPLDLWDQDRRVLATSLATWLQSVGNRTRYWNEPSITQFAPDGDPVAGWGMTKHLAFAKTHGKPVAVCDAATLTDDPDFPKWLASRLLVAPTPVLYVMIWDAATQEGDAGFSAGAKPRAAASWKSAFGAGSDWVYEVNQPAPAPLPPIVPPPPPIPPVPSPVPVPPPGHAEQAIVFSATAVGRMLILSGIKECGGPSSLAVTVNGVGVWTTAPLPDGPFAINAGPAPDVGTQCYITVFSVARAAVTFKVPASS